MTATSEEVAGLPDMKVSVRQVFGIDSDMESRPIPSRTRMFPMSTPITGSTAPRLPSWPASPRTGA